MFDYDKPDQQNPAGEYTGVWMPAPMDGHTVAYPTVGGDVALVSGMSDRGTITILSPSEALQLANEVFRAAIAADPDLEE